MEYYTTAELAKKWGITQRRVAIYCKEGRFDGAVLKGRTWLIPGNVEKPDDPRRVRKNKESTKCRGELGYMEGVIFVAGVYGVGKSTMCSSLSELLDIDFYSAGDLISECNKEIYGRNKKVKDKDNNQNVLVECVEHKLQEKDSIILAGHFCILGNDDKPDILPEFVYEKIQISAIVLLEASVQTIIKHLEQRDGKVYLSDLIESFIIQERKQAEKISQKIKVPLIIHEMTFDSTDVDIIFTKLQEAYGESFIRY